MRRRRDPAPSRIRYRLQRLWLRPSVRRGLRLGPPILAVVAGLSYVFFSPVARGAITQFVGNARAAVVNREEFQITEAVVTGASPQLRARVLGLAQAQLPSSTFSLDLKALKSGIELIPAVSEATVRIGPSGALRVDLSEREPQFVWRIGNRLLLLDAQGIGLGEIQRRTDRPRLPLVIGTGANGFLSEAREILDAAEPVKARLRGLQRIGGRRWNVVLDRDQILMLPEQSPVPAFRRVMEMDEKSDLLGRDVASVDLRDPQRPTIRMGPFATGELRRIQALQKGLGQ